MPTAIVTGASRGLGLALGRALVERGWRLVVDARGAEALEREWSGAPGRHRRPGQPRRRRPPPRARRRRRRRDRPPRQQRERARPEPAAGARRLSARRAARASTRSTSSRPSRSSRPRSRISRRGARIVNVTSDAAVEPYEGWGGYGSSKAALDQLTAILGAERPDLRVYAVDPGDMRTQMHQEAFPGEDISDRPLPEESVPGLLELIEGDLPSGRYRAARARGSGRVSAALAFELPERLEAHEPPEARGLAPGRRAADGRVRRTTGASSTPASATCRTSWSRATSSS